MLAQLTGDRPKDTGALGLLVVVDDNGSVVIKTDVGIVRTTVALVRADDNGLHDVALLHNAAGRCALDRSHDDIADRAGLAERTAHDAEAHNFLSAGVVGDFKTRLRLNH